MTYYRELKDALGNEVAIAWNDGTVLEHGPYGSMKVTSPQDNGWERVHYYYEDGTVEETFWRPGME